jgi:hypothetical protein
MRETASEVRILPLSANLTIKASGSKIPIDCCSNSKVIDMAHMIHPVTRVTNSALLRNP